MSTFYRKILKTNKERDFLLNQPYTVVTFRTRHGIWNRGFVCIKFDREKVVKINDKKGNYRWAYLEGEVSDEDVPFPQQGYALGFLEARATRDLIALHIHNTVEGYCDHAEEYCQELNDYLLKNLLWMQKEIAESYEDEYWQQVGNWRKRTNSLF